MSSSVQLLLPRQLHNDMLAHAQAEKPNECCGLLIGVFDKEQGVMRVQRRQPLVNEAASPIEYYAVSPLLLSPDLLAIYHSHPTSPAVPSQTDLQRSVCYTHVIHFIISLLESEKPVRGWWLSESEYREAIWTIVES